DAVIALVTDKPSPDTRASPRAVSRRLEDLFADRVDATNRHARADSLDRSLVGLHHRGEVAPDSLRRLPDDHGALDVPRVAPDDRVEDADEDIAGLHRVGRTEAAPFRVTGTALRAARAGR